MVSEQHMCIVHTLFPLPILLHLLPLFLPSSFIISFLFSVRYFKQPSSRRKG
jgi:hypothetical protein